MDQIKTGKFLKQLRTEKGLTQEQLAARFNVSVRTVSRWETGSNLPDISLLTEIADFYDVDVREIIDGERKNEMMNKETREVADKMAAYAVNEKDKMLRGVQVAGIIGVILTMAATVLQVAAYEPDLKRFGAVVATFASFVAMCIVTLYVTGLLKKIARHKGFVTAVKVLTILLLAGVTFYVFIVVAIVGMFGLLVSSAKVETSTSYLEYNNYIHNDRGPDSEYAMGNYPMFDVFPETIPDGADVKEYSLMYYNPWDPQIMACMTIDHGDGYGEEMARLSAIGVEPYTDYYSVTGEPDGYDIIAMDADDYNGFVYAMIPENSEDNTCITYIALVFCNYSPDVEPADYIPPQYLLKGLDVSDDNPYRQRML